MNATNATDIATRTVATRGRWAVAAAFFINGFVTGSWAPQIPLLLTRLDISEFVLGLLILVFGLGALTAMPFSGYLMTKRGSRPVVVGFAWIVVFALLLVALAPNVWPAGRPDRRAATRPGRGGRTARAWRRRSG